MHSFFFFFFKAQYAYFYKWVFLPNNHKSSMNYGRFLSGVSTVEIPIWDLGNMRYPSSFLVLDIFILNSL